MIWRPTAYLIEGELNNTTLGRITGWIRFAGLKNKMMFDLLGDFHRDIRGAIIRFRGDATSDLSNAKSYMEGFALHQTGKAGDITAGLAPQDYVDYPYIEWYGDNNGRVVLELEKDQIEIIDTPIPVSDSEPISRKEQNANLMQFMTQVASELKSRQVN